MSLTTARRLGQVAFIVGFFALSFGVIYSLLVSKAVVETGSLPTVVAGQAVVGLLLLPTAVVVARGHQTGRVAGIGLFLALIGLKAVTFYHGYLLLGAHSGPYFLPVAFGVSAWITLGAVCGLVGLVLAGGEFRENERRAPRAHRPDRW